MAAGAALLAAPAWAIASERKYVIGYLANDPDENSPTFQAFIGELAKLGRVRGRNIDIVYETSCGRDERFPELARKLVKRRVDLIVTTGTGSTRAAKAETREIPIVFGSVQNPERNGFIAALDKPGGNVTGLAILVQELGPKRLEKLKELVPNAKRIGRLFHRGATLAELQNAMELEDNKYARANGLEIVQVPVSPRAAQLPGQHCIGTDPSDLDAAFSAVKQNGIDAIYVKADALFVVNRIQIARLALKYRLPMMCADGRFADAGALASYGENFISRYRSAAMLVHNIHNDLEKSPRPPIRPAELPTDIEFVINLKTAKALGLSIPYSVRRFAHRVVA